jgi:hypothetical protein
LAKKEALIRYQVSRGEGCGDLTWKVSGIDYFFSCLIDDEHFPKERR